MKLSSSDQELIQTAFDVINNNKDLYPDLDLIVGSAVRSKSGNVYKGINLKTSHSVCAEQVAIGQALCNGERDLDTIVAVKFDKNFSPRVVSPCGLCRYIIDKLNLDINVIVIDAKTNKLYKVKSSDLLPFPYNRNI